MTNTERALLAAELYLTGVNTRTQGNRWKQLTGSDVIDRDVVLGLIWQAMGEAADRTSTNQGVDRWMMIETELKCPCWSCLVARDERRQNGSLLRNTFMVVCPTCGNKRCPHATDHQHACSMSNSSGQDGSRYR